MQPVKKEISTQSSTSPTSTLSHKYWAFTESQLTLGSNTFMFNSPKLKEGDEEKCFGAQMALHSQQSLNAASDIGSEQSLTSQAVGSSVSSCHSCSSNDVFQSDSADDCFLNYHSSYQDEGQSSDVRHHRRNNVVASSSASRIDSQLKRGCRQDAKEHDSLQHEANTIRDEDGDSVFEFEQMLHVLHMFRNGWSLKNSFGKHQGQTAGHLPSDPLLSARVHRSMENHIMFGRLFDLNECKEERPDAQDSTSTNLAPDTSSPNVTATALLQCDSQIPVNLGLGKDSLPEVLKSHQFRQHRTLSRQNSEPDYANVNGSDCNLKRYSAESDSAVSKRASDATVRCSSIFFQLEALQNYNSELLLNSRSSMRQKAADFDRSKTNQNIQNIFTRRVLVSDGKSSSDIHDTSVRPYFHHPLSYSVGNLNLELGHLQNQMTIELFALENFNEHRYGFLGKTIPFNSMLSWTKDCISKPMIRTDDKAVKKEAPEVFRLVQMYMEDRKSKIPQMQLALMIIQKNLIIEGLRDETYMQLCRQTTNNPKERSLMNGWILMGICLSAFFPSFRFQACLMGYICQHICSNVFTNNDFIALFASHCRQLLERSSQRNWKGTSPKINIDYVERSLKSIFHPSHFGSSLEDVMQMQRYKFPDKVLPWIQTTLSEAMLHLNCAQVEGIFRVPGDKDEISSLRSVCDRWELTVDSCDPHDLASLLKQWYRELYEPLIPYELYNECIGCLDGESAIAIVERLPTLNRLVLSYLIRFLQVFAATENSSVSKMDAGNLATVMAPNCLRCESDDMQLILKNTSKESNFIKMLILNLDTTFMNGIW